jgi:hypothetical protein
VIALLCAAAFVAGLVLGLLLGRWRWGGGRHRRGIRLRG